jgi:hypothetical protein
MQPAAAQETAQAPPEGREAAAPPWTPRPEAAPMAPGEPGHAEQPAGPHSEGWFADASYLYWRARRRDLDFAIVDTGLTVGPVGTVESLHWNPESGVRAGFGYYFPESSADIRLEYTYFHSRDARLLVAPPGGRLWATAAAPFGFTSVALASGVSSLNHNVLDLEMGERFQCSDCFSVRICGGARWASVDQGLDVTYDGAAGVPGIVAVGAQVHNPIEFDGGGLRFGAEAEWRMPWNLSFFLHGYGSMVVGDLRTEYSEFNAGAAVVSVVEHFYKVIPVVEMGAGISYRVNNLRFSVGYEFANWFGLVDSPDFVDDVHAGKIKRRAADLSLDGLVVKCAIEF